TTRIPSLQQQQLRGESSTRSTEGNEVERWAALIGGGALAAIGLARGSLGGLATALAGGCLAYCGATRRTPLFSAVGAMTGGESSGIRIEEYTTVQRPPEEVYRFWRNLENLPRFMHYHESVQTTEGNRSHWVAKGPLDVRVEWNAEITTDRPNEMIAWRSLPGSTVETEDSVHFLPAPGNRGRGVKVVMHYNPPAGKVGDWIAYLFGRSGEQETREDLRRFKRLIETSEIPTTRGQPSGRGRDLPEQTGMMVIQHRLAKGLGWFSIGLGLAELLTPEGLGKVIGVRDHETLLRVIGTREIASGIGILTQQHPTGGLWSRVAGDAMDLTLLGAALLSGGPGWGKTMAATAAVL